MSYLLLVIEPTGQRATRSEAEGEEAFAQMLHFADDLKARKLLLGVNSLVSDSTGARVQMRAGQRRVLDGPFAEAKEMVGGYFLVDCATRDEAVAIAAQCPATAWATIEVREIGPCYV